MDPCVCDWCAECNKPDCPGHDCEDICMDVCQGPCGVFS